MLRQGVLGIKVKIMKDQDPTGKAGPKNPLPDMVHILDAKEELPITQPTSQDFQKHDTEVPVAPSPPPVTGAEFTSDSF